MLRSVSLLVVFHAVASAEPSPPQTNPRAGFHYGASVGGVYLPVGEGISALVLRADLNWARSTGEVRLSPIGFVARESGDNTYGFGAMVERRWYATTALSVGVGAMASTIVGDGSGIAAGATLTPLAYRFGARRHLEFAVNAFLLRNFSTKSNLPGGYLSLTYLAL
jgi:hypothetical protein